MSLGSWQVPSAGQRLLLDLVSKLGDLVVNRPTLGHQRADLPLGVHDSGVVPAAEVLADLWQRQVGQLPAQVHGDLARGDEDTRSRRTAEVIDGQAEIRGGLS